MILYHGSNVVVKDPIIVKSDVGRDFGFAFYLTPIKEQAEKMAKRKMLRNKNTNKNSKAIVSVFEWDEEKTDLNYKNYPDADLEWLKLVVTCRSNNKYIHGYDIVEGKIADDTVGETVSFITDGILDMEAGLKRLKYQKINSQIAFCSEESLKHLKFIESYEVK